MKTIWKYEVPVQDEFVVPLPGRAEVLSVGVQYDKPQMWVLVDPNERRVPRTFSVVGTGHPVDLNRVGRFIGTFQLMDGVFIGHLFEK